ncbi:hypothetical protein BRETT_005172 [Brettanomyces bruxellensis]|uniref:Uncharacterized protein n=1 Tax=Dekkera bruxellensis TaxID=5007 RepID=A0A871R4Q0_DEKBR|nr:uncharacterized protein BRETT_005172 [Brettanomyces bruxellensis]QOU18112.1 hypothetical protein BRETT_005172 [Brettanomyces bruxellensis]
MVIGIGNGTVNIHQFLCDQLIVEPSSTVKLYSPEELGIRQRATAKKINGYLDDESIELNKYLQKTMPFAIMGSNAPEVENGEGNGSANANAGTSIASDINRVQITKEEWLPVKSQEDEHSVCTSEMDPKEEQIKLEEEIESIRTKGAKRFTIEKEGN